MIAVRPNYAQKFAENEYLIEAFHPHPEKLDESQKEGCIMVEEMPIRPAKQEGMRRARVINVQTGEVRWVHLPE